MCFKRYVSGDLFGEFPRCRLKAPGAARPAKIWAVEFICGNPKSSTTPGLFRFKSNWVLSLREILQVFHIRWKADRLNSTATNPQRSVASGRHMREGSFRAFADLTPPMRGGAEDRRKLQPAGCLFRLFFWLAS